LPGHWLDSALTSAERGRRKAALDRLAVVRDGHRVYDGPAVLALIRRWDKAFEWVPSEDRSVLIHDQWGRLIETSQLAEKLLEP